MSILDYQLVAQQMIQAASANISGGYNVVFQENIVGTNFPVVTITLGGDITVDYNTITGSFTCVVAEMYDPTLYPGSTPQDQFICNQLNVEAITYNTVTLMEAIQVFAKSNPGAYLIEPRFEFNSSDVVLAGPASNYSGTNFRRGLFTFRWGLTQG